MTADVDSPAFAVGDLELHAVHCLPRYPPNKNAEDNTAAAPAPSSTRIAAIDGPSEYRAVLPGPARARSRGHDCAESIANSDEPRGRWAPAEARPCADSGGSTHPHAPLTIRSGFGFADDHDREIMDGMKAELKAEL